MEKLYNWTAKRSGAGLVIEGVNSVGKPRKLTKIAAISLVGNTVRATATDGRSYELHLYTIIFGGPPRS